ncbi:MAG TPA: methyltransferase domain-containing protein [Longimicrobiaceae bacterium]|nr:methyltransferase domain-containing protein [Longimicrobiaceae bacterium]
MYRLYHEFAHRYDLHTPPGHYKHDHRFVIDQALRVAPAGCRLLDVGCGTGVFLEKALAAGIDAYGIDAAPEMIDVAQKRLGGDRVRVQRMQEISGGEVYHVVCALSWTIHYCETAAELDDVVRRCKDVLLSGGVLILQVADDEQMTGAVNVDREPSSSGDPDDTFFIHRFRPLRDAEHRVLADYVYVCQEHAELLAEQHKLRFANPSMILGAMRRAGFEDVRLTSLAPVTPFIFGRKR